MPLDAAGCRWMQLDEAGCRWMKLDAAGCRWMQSQGRRPAMHVGRRRTPPCRPQTQPQPAPERIHSGSCQSSSAGPCQTSALARPAAALAAALATSGAAAAPERSPGVSDADAAPMQRAALATSGAAARWGRREPARGPRDADADDAVAGPDSPTELRRSVRRQGPLLRVWPAPEQPRVFWPAPEQPRVFWPAPEQPRVFWPAPEQPRVFWPAPEQPRVFWPAPEQPQSASAGGSRRITRPALRRGRRPGRSSRPADSDVRTRVRFEGIHILPIRVGTIRVGTIRISTIRVNTIRVGP
jgi:hypothetical protein